MKKLLLVVILMLGLMFSAFTQNSWAAIILDFGVIAPTTGSISYAGGANPNPLVGTDIEVDNVVLIGGAPNTPLNISGGILSFTTGNLSGISSSEWSFAPGGTISLTGAISLIGITDVNTTLFSGTFSDTTKVLVFGSTYKIVGTTFTDTKNPTLLSHYQLNWDECVGNFNLGFNASGLPPSAFESSTILSGDITNSPVPEPGSMLLLGMGILGLYGVGRKRKI